MPLPYPERPTLESLFDWGRKLIKQLDTPASQAYLKLPSYSVAQLAQLSKATDGSVIYVKDASGGPTPAYADGGVWKRFSDGSTIS